MGKRKHEGDERDGLEYVVRKIKKLERKIKRGRRRRRRHDVADSDSSSPRSSKSPPPLSLEGEKALSLDGYYSDEEIEPTSVQLDPVPSTSATSPPLVEETEPIASTSAAPAATTNVLQNGASIQSTSAAVATLEPSIPTVVAPEITGELLDIFGADPSVVKEYSNEIQSDLALRLQHIVVHGLLPEVRKDLCAKYLAPSNCTLIDAPELNPEIKVAITEPVRKRDVGIEMKQRQLSKSIACVSEAINILISKEEKDTSVIKLLMDACRLLCDHQHQDSMTRRNFILFNLKKDIKDQLVKTKVDKLLFGSNLSETLKIAKSITKSGEELKCNNKQPATRTKPTYQATPQPQIRNNLNWKAPPLNRRPPTGNQRRREPAPRSQHANSLRASYRAPLPPPPPPQRPRRR